MCTTHKVSQPQTSVTSTLTAEYNGSDIQVLKLAEFKKQTLQWLAAWIQDIAIEKDCPVWDISIRFN